MCWLSNSKNLTKYISKLYGSLYLRDVEGGNLRWKKFPYKLLYNAMDGHICIGNHMISRAIGKKKSTVSFSNTTKIARARRASVICSL